MPVFRRDRIVFGEDVALNRHQPGRAGLVAMVVIVGMRVVVAVRMRVRGAVGMGVGVLMPMRIVAVVFMRVGMRMIVRVVVAVIVMKILDPLFALAATAGATHHTISISLSRISSPPCTSSLAPPQRGHGAPRAAIATEVSQSRQ